MDWEKIPALLGAIGVIVSGVAKFAGRAGRLRGQIRHDQETLGKLDAGPTRALLSEHIDATVRQLVRLERDRANRTNDWTGVGLAIAFLALAIGLAVWELKSDWATALNVAAWCGVVVLAVFGIVGFADSVNRKPEQESARE